MKIEKVGVIGCGLMGSGIAQVAAMAGHQTLVREVSRELIDRGFSAIDKSLAKLVEKGKLSPQERDRIKSRIGAATSADSLADCDLVIEAATENLETKQQIFRDLDEVCRKECIFASNTSSLSITQLMMSTQRPERFVGLHFFNPVPLMKLVEVVRTLATDAEVFETACGFAEGLGKTAVRCEDSTGFIVNRLLVPYLLDAVRALEEGVGSMEDIDRAMKLGCGHPMGPFTLLDLVGLDTTFHIANIMFEEFREKRFAPPPLLKRMVQAGRWGRKTGRGFYEY